jgi:predicted TIM-barrel fold metal-dependent hydrolase
VTGPESLRGRRYAIISCDDHAGADLLDYKPYLEKKWHGEFDEWAKNYSNPWQFLDPRIPEEGKEDMLLAAASSWHSSLNWDTPKRQRHLESNGVVAEVIFPNTAPPFMPTSPLAGAPPKTRDEYEHRWAGLKAHNRWLADFCREVPGRRAGIAQVMLYDVEDTVAEVTAAREAGLMGGILLPMEGTEGANEPLYSPDLEPLWAVCEDLGVPIHRHASEPCTFPDPDHPELIAIGLAEYLFWNHRALAHLIFAGVFERHPGLTFVFAETGSGWVPGHLALLDSIYQDGKRRRGLLRPMVHETVAKLSMSPSEYFRRNCYLGASLLAPEEAANRDQVGFDRIMWGVDYPHAEGCYPYTKEALRLTFAGVPEDELRMMLSGTAAKVYGFDLDSLQAVADRIGPTVSEAAQPLEKLPRVPDDTWALVFDREFKVSGVRAMAETS